MYLKTYLVRRYPKLPLVLRLTVLGVFAIMLLNNKGMARGGNPLLNFRSYYPIFPPSIGVSIDYGMEENLSMPYTPDVVLFNSDLQHFVKVCTPWLWWPLRDVRSGVVWRQLGNIFYRMLLAFYVLIQDTFQRVNQAVHTPRLPFILHPRSKKKWMMLIGWMMTN